MGFVRLFTILLAVVFCDARQAAALAEMDVDDYLKLPPPEACRLLDFDNVEIIPGFVSGTWRAVVLGTKPWVTMAVNLVPRVYTKQPEYWGIEVVGCPTGIGVPTTTPYAVDTKAENMGIKGIEIIGGTRAEKFEVPPR